MKIVNVDTFLVQVPLKWPVGPYQTRYSPLANASSLLVRLVTDAGVVGWGETPQDLLGQPFSGQEADKLRPHLLGKDPTAIAAMYADWGLTDLDASRKLPFQQSAVEMAMWDILGKVCNKPVYALLGGLYREEVELAACMGIRPPNEAAEIAKHYVELGYSTLKTKAGRDPEEDLAMVRAIRDAVGDRLRLRIDPNMGYSPEIAQQLAIDLQPFNLEYFEQPMAAESIDDSARIRKLTKTPLALNESVTTLESVHTILDLDAADVILPDTFPCGGVWAVKLIAEVASSAGIPCVMHCCWDLGPKTAAMLHLVASTPNFSLANDCTYYGQDGDVIKEPFRIRNGYMSVPTKPGLGFEVDDGQLRRFVVSSSS